METITGELPTGATNPAPTITCWLPEGEHTGSGIAILPGGGYGALAEHEGRGYAEYFAAAGIAAFVVTYRLGTDGFRHPAMLEDALAALRAVRARADQFGVDPRRIGIMGSSAGGHLASQVLVAWSNYESDVLLRPDFGILCYPVIASQGLHAYAGSMRNLAGQDPSPELLDALSSDRYVGPERRRVFYGIPGKIRPFRLKIVCSLLRRCVPMTCPLNCIYTVEADMAWVLAPSLTGAPNACAGSVRLSDL